MYTAYKEQTGTSAVKVLAKSHSYDILRKIIPDEQQDYKITDKPVYEVNGQFWLDDTDSEAVTAANAYKQQQAENRLIAQYVQTRQALYNSYIKAMIEKDEEALLEILADIQDNDKEFDAKIRRVKEGDYNV